MAKTKTNLKRNDGRHGEIYTARKNKSKKKYDRSIGVTNVTHKNNLFRFIVQLLFIVAGIEFLVTGWLYVSGTTVGRNFAGLEEIIRPSGHTDLYFEDAAGLPKDAIENKEYTFRFTVHNLENGSMVYPYQVYVNIDGLKHEIDSGSFTLGDNRSKTISENYTLPVSGNGIQVVVSLIGKKQQIQFTPGKKN